MPVVPSDLDAERPPDDGASLPSGPMPPRRAVALPMPRFRAPPVRPTHVSHANPSEEAPLHRVRRDVVLLLLNVRLDTPRRIAAAALLALLGVGGLAQYSFDIIDWRADPVVDNTLMFENTIEAWLRHTRILPAPPHTPLPEPADPWLESL